MFSIKKWFRNFKKSVEDDVQVKTAIEVDKFLKKKSKSLSDSLHVKVDTSKLPADIDVSEISEMYVHTQSEPATRWSVEHNLNSQNLNAHLYDDRNIKINHMPFVKMVWWDKNTIDVVFGHEMTGKIIITKTGDAEQDHENLETLVHNKEKHLEIIDDSLCEVCVVFTGSLPSGMTRTEAADVVKSHGGLVEKRISDFTTHLVCGAQRDDVKVSSKMKQAEKKGIKVIDEETLWKMAKN